MRIDNLINKPIEDRYDIQAEDQSVRSSQPDGIDILSANGFTSLGSPEDDRMSDFSVESSDDAITALESSARIEEAERDQGRRIDLDNLKSIVCGNGWFNTESDQYRMIMRYFSNKTFTVEELFKCGFDSDPSREGYGRDLPRRDSSFGQVAYQSASFGSEIKDKGHAEKESGRRDRHRDFQSILYERCPELAHVLSDQYWQGIKGKNNRPNRKPGKDDQFVATLFQIDLQAIIAQVLYHEYQQLRADYKRIKLENHKLKRTRKMSSALDMSAKGSRKTYSEVIPRQHDRMAGSRQNMHGYERRAQCPTPDSSPITF